MQNQPMQNRPTFQQIREHQHFDIRVISEKAGVEAIVVAYMLRDVAVEEEQADKVLAALSSMRGQVYTRETVKVTIHRKYEAF